MTILKCKGRNIQIGEQGYLVGHNKSGKNVVQTIARHEGLKPLSSKQVELIEFIGSCFDGYHSSPFCNKFCCTRYLSYDCIKKQSTRPELVRKIDEVHRKDDIHVLTTDREYTEWNRSFERQSEKKHIMYSESELCDKIIALYPIIKFCGINIDLAYDGREKVWNIHLEKDTHSLNHTLEVMDADTCMEGKQCVTLGLQIAQLIKKIDGNKT